MIAGRGISWRATAALCTLSLGGCDLLFRLDPVAGKDDAPMGDAKLPDAAVDAMVDAPGDAGHRSLCPGSVTPLFDYTFDPTTITNICKPWGSAYFDPNVIIAQNGELSITPDSANANGSVGGCTMDTTMPLGGSVTAVVTSVVTGGGAYNVLELHTINYQIKQGGGLLSFQDATSTNHGTVTYNSTMKYWRIRFGAPTQIIGEYSTDGITYSLLGAVTTTPPSTGKIELSVGTTVAGSSSSGKFDELVICP